MAAFKFPFVGGDPSLDLVNTLVHRGRPDGPDDLLRSGQHAVEWFRLAGLLSPDAAGRLDPDAALYSARRLRAALDALYRPLATGEPHGDDSARGLLTLNAVLDQGRERVQLRHEPPDFHEWHTFETIGPSDPAVGVARTAATLLHTLTPGRLKVCQNPDCDLLFHDTSRNASRRWCDMSTCGNVTKQTRYRARHDRS
ncbi:putative RNA-binding Zn ribbon-like protein [Deinococcus metalli]|uniref:Putative RNA-binding Zn ribbon-like protein n=1 Tax=Deinococcus metalli TaxID=1141878 RepID=A0A7W8NPN9_9DEIO|nr:CGNR zinc finger domain-containing protein [Deinococcus metalli]MBB5378169.1 putative RNA-binding Zn ribbon-like protein [Deinococcus metalli]GHF56550.1 hypothetical protein GCM10017781_36080 [Deinococcus metalli]